jgi:hypothetical protein
VICRWTDKQNKVQPTIIAVFNSTIITAVAISIDVSCYYATIVRKNCSTSPARRQPTALFLPSAFPAMRRIALANPSASEPMGEKVTRRPFLMGCPASIKVCTRSISIKIYQDGSCIAEHRPDIARFFQPSDSVSKLETDSLPGSPVNMLLNKK